MSSVKPESVAGFPVPTDEAHVLSFDTNVSSTIARFDVDYDRLERGIEDVGMPKDVSEHTSIHFSYFDPRVYGTNASNSRFSRIAFRLPTVLVPALYETGLRKHQGWAALKVGVNVHPHVFKRIRKNLREEHDVSRSNVSRLTDGDCLALVVAHELRHSVVDLEVRRKDDREQIVKQYISSCVQRGRDNPWARVISVTQHSNG